MVRDEVRSSKKRLDFIRSKSKDQNINSSRGQNINSSRGNNTSRFSKVKLDKSLDSERKMNFGNHKNSMPESLLSNRSELRKSIKSKKQLSNKNKNQQFSIIGLNKVPFIDMDRVVRN